MRDDSHPVPGGSAGMGLMDSTCLFCNGKITLWSRLKGAWCSQCKKWSWPESVGQMPTLPDHQTQDTAHLDDHVDSTLPGTLVDKKRPVLCRLLPCDHVIDLTQNDLATTPCHTKRPRLRRSEHAGYVGVFDEAEREALRLQKNLGLI